MQQSDFINSFFYNPAANYNITNIIICIIFNIIYCILYIVNLLLFKCDQILFFSIIKFLNNNKKTGVSSCYLFFIPNYYSSILKTSCHIRIIRRENSCVYFIIYIIKLFYTFFCCCIPYSYCLVISGTYNSASC